MDVLILAALILLNGVFAMSEIALVTARKSRLQRLADEGDKRATSAIALGEEPTRFLSTVQIGITAIGLLNGIYGEAALADPFAVILQDMGMDAKTSSIASTAIVVIGITYLSIVVGELVPKRLAQINPEGIARLMARPISLLASLSRPFVFLLTLSTNLLLHLLGQGKTKNDNDSLTEEDIQAVLKEKSQNGIVEKQEHEMVRNVFHFDDRRVTSLMTPRNDVVALDLDQAINNNLNKLIASEHHCFPVTKGDLNNVQGVITTKQLLQYQISASHSDISQYTTTPEFVPETWTGTQLLEYFRHTGIPMALVVDEYGDIQGIVTPKDILEALAGEFKTCNPDDVWSVENDDGSWSMDGLIPTQVLKDLLDIKRLPDEDKGGYHTLSGMVMWCLGGMPTVDDSVDWEGWHFDVVNVEGNRIDKVTVSKLCDHSESEDGQQQPQGQEEQQEDK
ncbi:hemolysin family protein [Photobacterium nomapromontoriensis]|uniref:hemolysin family protein n=1 Tax=Photobacterium nomapromontoriensis TaxID=2910237 RepID=UPI003D0D856A